jgi:large subunit ribosomal protein L11
MSSIKGTARLLVLAGSAKPSPAIGQALGPLGVNMMEFCKDFNAKTATLKTSALMRVKLTAYEDRTFKYNLFAPPTSWFLKRCAGIQKGAGAPGKEVVASVSVKAVYEIAKSKQAFDPILQEIPLQSLAKTIVASAKSMGIQIIGGNSSKRVSVSGAEGNVKME